MQNKLSGLARFIFRTGWVCVIALHVTLFSLLRFSLTNQELIRAVIPKSTGDFIGFARRFLLLRQPFNFDPRAFALNVTALLIEMCSVMVVSIIDFRS